MRRCMCEPNTDDLRFDARLKGVLFHTLFILLAARAAKGISTRKAGKSLI
jgi:hypothetical protein